MSDEKILLRIGQAEAVVLFEMLADFSNQSALSINNEAERIALFRLHGALENTLVEPFRDDYPQIVDQSRSQLIQQSGFLQV